MHLCPVCPVCANSNESHPKYLRREGVLSMFFGFQLPSQEVFGCLGIVFYIFLVNISRSLNVLSFRSWCQVYPIGAKKRQVLSLWRPKYRPTRWVTRKRWRHVKIHWNAWASWKWWNHKNKSGRTKIMGCFLSHRIHVWNIYLHYIGEKSPHSKRKWLGKKFPSPWDPNWVLRGSGYLVTGYM